MVNNNADFLPTVAIPPGETIRENIKYLGMCQKELAVRLDVTEKHLSHILNGISPITYDTALKLEVVIGPSADFWMQLEANYRLNKARLEKENEIEIDLQVLEQIPYEIMADYDWVIKETNKTARVLNCREYFAVSKLSQIKPAYDVLFRQHKELKNISEYGVLAWLRRAEIQGMDPDVDRFSKTKLKAMIPKFRELSFETPEYIFTEIQKLCAECGVSLVLIKYIPKTYICGATLWRNGKAIIALSLRVKGADSFWFSFFHEIAHILAHTKKEFHICYDNISKEDEANILASNYLIPQELYSTFISEYDYTNRDEIIKYANKIGVAPFILVGRLQHDKLIEYKLYNDLIPRFEIA